jgi:ketosteroid isomerase-like protein
VGSGTRVILRSMSRENVELVRRAIEGYNRAGVEALHDFLHPDVEFTEDPQFPEAGVYRGRDSVEAYFGEFRQQMAGHTLEVEEIVEAGDDVVAVVRERARGTSSDAEVEWRAAFVWTMRGGTAVRGRGYLDPAEALRAVGLRE